MSLLKKTRLKGEEIKKVLNSNKVVRGDFLSVKFLRNDISRLRFVVIISNKVSKKSVERNLLRRRIKEIIRRNEKYMKSDFDLVVLTTKNILNKSREEIKGFLEGAINKILSQ